jgi:hypothetical protein
MELIYPSLELPLPEGWSLKGPDGELPCTDARLWLESMERVLPEGWEEEVGSPDEDPLSPRHQVHGLLLRFSGTAVLWRRIQAGWMLGYEAQRCGPIFGGGFKESRPLHFEAALRSEKVTLLSLVSDDLTQVRDVFLDSSVSDELRDERSYRLLSVTQKLERNPKIEMGLQMDWSDL